PSVEITYVSLNEYVAELRKERPTTAMWAAVHLIALHAGWRRDEDWTAAVRHDEKLLAAELAKGRDRWKENLDGFALAAISACENAEVDSRLAKEAAAFLGDAQEKSGTWGKPIATALAAEALMRAHEISETQIQVRAAPSEPEEKAARWIAGA